MTNFFLAIFFSAYFSHHGVLASVSPYDQDVQDSKSRFLVSGVSYQQMRESGKGALTLCFKEIKDSYDHVSLVFEYFTPLSQEVALLMVHYGRDDDCCGKEKIMYDNRFTALSKVYRGIESSPSTGIQTYRPPIYERYASWFILNDSLLKGVAQAEKDKVVGYRGNCVNYATRIMKTIGLQKLDFGWWTTKPSNLKLLVDDHITPKPDKKKRDMQRLPTGAS